MKTLDLSGFGGSYERTCQKMLTNALAFLSKHRRESPNFGSFKNVMGICVPENGLAKQMEGAIMRGIDDATGAMFQAVVSHALYIHKNGYKEWIAQGIKDGRVIDLHDPHRAKLVRANTSKAQYFSSCAYSCKIFTNSRRTMQ